MLLFIALLFNVHYFPAAAVNRMKFINRDGLGEYIDDDNRLVAWGGRDTWRYAWEPELRTPPSEGSAAITLSTNIMDVVPKSMLTFSKNEEGDFGSQIEIKNVSAVPIVYKVSLKRHGKSIGDEENTW